MGTKYICRSIMSRDIIRCSKLRLLIITLWREGAILSGGSEQVTRHLPEVSYILFSKCSDLSDSSYQGHLCVALRVPPLLRLVMPQAPLGALLSEGTAGSDTKTNSSLMNRSIRGSLRKGQDH